MAEIMTCTQALSKEPVEVPVEIPFSVTGRIVTVTCYVTGWYHPAVKGSFWEPDQDAYVDILAVYASGCDDNWLGLLSETTLAEIERRIVEARR